ncbi:MAG: 3'-5' exonuclease [Fusobacteriaceae bacterium]
MKILWVDTETTGLSEDAAPIQISGIIEISGEIKEEFNIYLSPFEGAVIENSALEVHGLSLEEINAFQESSEGYKEFIKIMDKYVNRYDKNDKFIVAGYNVEFDIKKLRRLAKAHDDKFIGSYLGFKTVDPMNLILPFQVIGKLPQLENNKLVTWCEHFGIELKAHDSLEDIRATRELFYKILG